MRDLYVITGWEAVILAGIGSLVGAALVGIWAVPWAYRAGARREAARLEEWAVAELRADLARLERGEAL